ncbi:MAG: hypothetical protein JWL58_5224, partial [Streptosporangiaceae bacterium]|nr:hypothetical protein [Streptosporangiaceae bacterium]
LVPGTGSNTEPTLANHPPFTPYATDTAIRRGGDGYFEWLDHVWPAAGCSCPVRLIGDLHTIDPRTGATLDTVPTSALPDGVIYKACGNRRTTVCPSCAEIYRRDAYHLIRSGLAGGKTVPVSVAKHPAVFATFTAPSFGPVHSRHVKTHHCTDKARCACKPSPCYARRSGTADTCPHGVVFACFDRHDSGDELLGRPFCLDCYDHNAHVVWNNQAGELWRRTKQTMERHLNRQARLRGLPRVRLSHGKAAEYQLRGAVHFHVLLRLDGIDEGDPTTITAPPAGLTVVDLEEAVRHAAAVTGHTTAEHPARPGGWHITWGDPKGTDVRPITLRGDNPVTDAMVAAYLAKYATKGTEVTGHTSRRLDDTTVRLYADPAGTHVERLIAACWHLGDNDTYEGLRRWAHMLGFGGHFLTKARRYSITFTALRQARIDYRRTDITGPEHSEIRTAEHTGEETTLIIGDLTYAGTGWKTTGDALLANTAADQARKRRQIGREELAHEHASAAGTQLTAA